MARFQLVRRFVDGRFAPPPRCFSLAVAQSTTTYGSGSGGSWRAALAGRAEAASGKTRGVAALRPAGSASCHKPPELMSRTKSNRLHKYRRDPDAFGRLEITTRDKE